MTNAPTSILNARKLIKQQIPELDWIELGIVGSTAHAQGGDSYHLGKDQIRARDGRNRYSVDESSRDQNGLSDYASGLDIGQFKIKTPKGTFDQRDLAVWIVEQCKLGAADTKDIREIIYTPDGKVVKRWDRQGVRTSGDSSHLTHNHISWFRDSASRDKTSIFRRWFQHIGAIEEDNVPLTPAEIQAIAVATAKETWAYKLQDPYDPENPKRNIAAGTWLKYNTSRGQSTRIEAAIAALTTAVGSLDTVDVTPDELRDAIIAALAKFVEPKTTA